MQIKLINLAVAGTITLFAGVAASEENFTGSWYIMPTIGAMNADSDLEQEGSIDAAYGIRLGKQLSQHWDVQLGITHSRADIDIDTLNFNIPPGDGKYKQTLIGVDALYLLSRDKFRPFLLAGLGAARNSIDGYDGGGLEVDEDNWSWMANVGAGFQYQFNETVGLQADIRHVWSRADGPNGTNPVQPFSSDKTVGNTYLNLGMIINFGVPKKVVAALAPEPTYAALPEIAPVEEETHPYIIEKTPEDIGPQPPAFEKITLQAEVLFDFDKSVVKPEGRRILDAEVVEKMKAHPEVELILIIGHADRIGTEQYNQALSERRAAAVKTYLVSQGIDAARMRTVGKGESEPVVECKGVRGKALIDCLQPNRRVVVEIEVQRIVK